MPADATASHRDPPTGPHSTLHPTDPPTREVAGPTDTPGFELHDPIGVGGMGVVHRARDLTLRRDVAVKVLKDTYAPAGAAARRFVAEAEITAQLQHPGIPPVYHVGRRPDGRPFLAMKLVKGDTLAELLAANPDRGRLVAVFEGVCQAVAYAHAHGVIHRDLKPANVMVGAFGEVQVMDWGLAKVLAGGEAETTDPEATAAQTEVRSLREESDHTQDGQALGTPAFMPPEQAVGDVAAMDRRSDVFGLGAVLCAVLTNSPPFVGDTAASTRALAARAKLDDAFAKLDASGAEPGLVALCKRCLSGEKADRPADAGEVAEAVAGLRRAADDRARAAEVERGRSEVRRRLQLRLGGLAAGVLLAGIAGTGWQWRRAVAARERVIEQEAEVQAALRRETGERERVTAALDRERQTRSELLVALIGQARQLAARAEFTSPDGAKEFTRDVERLAGLWATAAGIQAGDFDVDAHAEFDYLVGRAHLAADNSEQSHRWAIGYLRRAVRLWRQQPRETQDTAWLRRYADSLFRLAEAERYADPVPDLPVLELDHTPVELDVVAAAVAGGAGVALPVAEAAEAVDEGGSAIGGVAAATAAWSRHTSPLQLGRSLAAATGAAGVMALSVAFDRWGLLECLAVRRRLAEQTDDRSDRAAVADTLERLSRWTGGAGARSWAEAALAERRWLAAGGASGDWEAVIKARASLATWWRGAGDLRTAVSHLDAADTELAEYASLHGKDASRYARYCLSQATAETFLVVGDHRRVAAAAAVHFEWNNSSWDWWQVGSLLADCVRLARFDLALDESARRRAADEYTHRAVEALAKAIERDPDRFGARLAGDKALSPIRDTGDFRRLLDQRRTEIAPPPRPVR